MFNDKYTKVDPLLCSHVIKLLCLPIKTKIKGKFVAFPKNHSFPLQGYE